MGNKHLYILLFIAVVFSACSNTKYLTGNQKLYTGADIKVDPSEITKSDEKFIANEMQGLVRPQPNSSILGLRVKLWLYNKTHLRKNFIQKLLSKYGEPPVLISSVDLASNSNIMQNRLQNEGFFQAQASGDTLSKGKTAKAIFSVQPGPSYSIRNIHFPTGKTDLDTAVAGTAKQTVLIPGNNYNLDVMKGERLRIDARLKEEGFYYFAPENLIMRIDTPIANHQVDVTVEIKPETADRARNIYSINNIYIYPNYTLRDTSLMLNKAQPYRNYFVVQKREYVHDYVFKNVVQFQKGSTYSRTEHNKALNRFVELGPFKFVKNRFEDVSADSPKLNVYYFLTQYPRKSLRFEVLGRTTSANFTGTQVSLNWRNRNAFKGAELLTVSLFGSTDVQVSGQNSGYNVYQAGIQTNLSWPRFISPFNFKSRGAYVPHTNLMLQYALTNRQKLYTLNSFSGSWGYQWRENEHKSHELNLLNVTVVNAANVSNEYLDSLRKPNANPLLKHVIDNQLTFGPSYSYTYTNTTDDYRTNTLYYNGKISTSALLLGLVSGADTLAGKVGKLFGTPYNQYVKMEHELRYYHKTGVFSQIAARMLFGVGMPFGNSTIMPYSQQFFIGGTNSLRGFRARSIGPGIFQPTQNNGINGGFLPDESGDIKIEGNIEYRPKLFSIVRGALFVDAGNIWNIRPHDKLPGSAFGKNFINQMAVDCGLGLRFDVTILVLRTDMGFPLRKPWESGFHLDTHNGVFNLAIGYPF